MLFKVGSIQPLSKCCLWLTKAFSTTFLTLRSSLLHLPTKEQEHSTTLLCSHLLLSSVKSFRFTMLMPDHSWRISLSTDMNAMPLLEGLALKSWSVLHYLGLSSSISSNTLVRITQNSHHCLYTGMSHRQWLLSYSSSSQHMLSTTIMLILLINWALDGC